jgi:hypothetical protein
MKRKIYAKKYRYQRWKENQNRTPEKNKNLNIRAYNKDSAHSEHKYNLWPKVPIFSNEFCHFCGKPGIIIEKFPRRGYGKNESTKLAQFNREKMAQFC